MANSGRELTLIPDDSREEMMLRQVWANAFTHLPWSDAFVIDESLPLEVTRQIAGPQDVAAALDCWRSKMVAAVDEVVIRLTPIE
jgi:hypothetical protein